MDLFITILHILVCVFLIIVVLLQTGKGAEVGAIMGGAGSQALFGGGGSGNFLSKLTGYAAGIFMVTSIGLTIINRSDTSGSIVDDLPEPPPAEVEPYSGAMTGSASAFTDAVTATTSPNSNRELQGDE